MTRLFLSLAVICPLLAGCATSPSPIVYPAEAGATLDGFTRAVAFRVGLASDHPGAGGRIDTTGFTDKVDSFVALETAPLSPDLARAIADFATDPPNFHDGTRQGDFVPTIAWCFYRHLPNGHGQDTLEFLVSFAQDEALIVTHDSYRHEYFRRLLGIDPGKERLLELARQSFPSDADLNH